MRRKEESEVRERSAAGRHPEQREHPVREVERKGDLRNRLHELVYHSNRRTAVSRCLGDKVFWLRSKMGRAGCISIFMELTFSNDASFARFRAIADKIEADPALLRIPLENIERWIANGSDAVHRLEEWRGIILAAQQSAEGMAALLSLLRDNREEARHLKSYAPFPGVLTTQERDHLSCGFSH